jgi:hypothetical protein
MPHWQNLKKKLRGLQICVVHYTQFMVFFWGSIEYKLFTL